MRCLTNNTPFSFGSDFDRYPNPGINGIFTLRDRANCDNLAGLAALAEVCRTPVLLLFRCTTSNFDLS